MKIDEHEIIDLSRKLENLRYQMHMLNDCLNIFDGIEELKAELNSAEDQASDYGLERDNALEELEQSEEENKKLREENEQMNSLRSRVEQLESGCEYNAIVKAGNALQA